MSWSLRVGAASAAGLSVSFPRVSSESADLGPEFSLFLSSPGGGRGGFSVLFLVSCFPSPPCVLAGAHFCGRWPEGMFWSCQDGRRLGLANPGRRCSILPVPRHSVKEPRGATSPGLCVPTSCVMSVPSATTHLSCFRQHRLWEEAGLRVGGVAPGRAGSPGLGSSFCPRRLVVRSHLTLDQSAGSPP